MRRAGYEVWIDYEEPGSWEEGPPNLSDMLTRDRRWCAGNLQHFWFLFARGIDLGSRLQILIGLMAYLCSPIWLLFLVASAISTYQRVQFLTLSAGPEDLGASSSKYTEILFCLTLVFLFAPRILGLIRAMAERKGYGGGGRLILSALLENLLSLLLAPVLMLFHTLFVVLTLLGLQIRWNAQNRADTALDFTHCLVLYGWISCLGLLAETVAMLYLGNFSLWLTPIFAGWILAPVLAWVTSSPQVGLACRKAGLFLTPDEVAPADELKGLDATSEPRPGISPPWTQALVCPYVQAVHLSLVRLRDSDVEDDPDPADVRRAEHLLREGPQALSPRDRLRLLWDAEAVYDLHQEVWSRPKADLHPSWLVAQRDAAENPLLSDYLLRD
jgi:membrane glycosyltransferase